MVVAVRQQLCSRGLHSATWSCCKTPSPNQYLFVTVQNLQSSFVPVYAMPAMSSDRMPVCSAAGGPGHWVPAVVPPSNNRLHKHPEALAGGYGHAWVLNLVYLLRSCMHGACAESITPVYTCVLLQLCKVQLLNRLHA